jgi:hypothetical protein
MGGACSLPRTKTRPFARALLQTAKEENEFCKAEGFYGGTGFQPVKSSVLAGFRVDKNRPSILMITVRNICLAHHSSSNAGSIAAWLA